MVYNGSYNRYKKYNTYNKYNKYSTFGKSGNKYNYGNYSKYKKQGNRNGRSNSYYNNNNNNNNNNEFNFRTPIPIFDQENRDLLYQDENVGFERLLLSQLDVKTHAPEDVVKEAKSYFIFRYNRDRKNKKERPSHWLNSTSSTLTRLKNELKLCRLATYPYRRKLHITKKELAYLDKLNHSRLEQKLDYHSEVDLTLLVRKLYELLFSEEPEDITVAIAGLTGRRQTEVVYSMNLAPPLTPLAHRYPSFWARVTGFSKARKQDLFAVKVRELPLLAPRKMLVEALEELRDVWPSDSHEMASELYCKRISASVKRHLSPLGISRLHDLRRTFVQASYRLFNERDTVLVGYASTVLGHKRKLSKRIMTYLMIITKNPPTLDMIFDLSGRKDLKECEPEPQRLL